GGSTPATATVTVGQPKPVIGSFTAKPTTITSDQSSTLSWSGITNATSCSIDNGVGMVPCADGSRTVAPATTTTYTLTATGPGGSTPATAAVTVTAPAPQITVTPSSGPASTTTFNVSGTGFTPGGQVIEHLTGRPPTTRFADSNGHISVGISVASPGN